MRLVADENARLKMERVGGTEESESEVERLRKVMAAAARHWCATRATVVTRQMQQLSNDHAQPRELSNSERARSAYRAPEGQARGKSGAAGGGQAQADRKHIEKRKDVVLLQFVVDVRLYCMFAILFGQPSLAQGSCSTHISNGGWLLCS